MKILLIIFGLFLSFIFLEAGLRIGGFVLLSMQDYRNRQSIQQKGAYRIMCLGNSTTQGQYPAFLEEILNQRNTAIKSSVIDRGLAGTTTSAILERLNFDLDQYHPDMVVTMMETADEEGLIPYGAATTSKNMLFLRSCRTYKLARFLWLHILEKAKERGLYKPDKDNHAEPILTEDTFKKAIELNPQDVEAYLELGRFYQDRGKLLQAEDIFKKAIESNPENDYAYVRLGRFYWEENKLLQAEDIFKKAIEMNSKIDLPYFCLGQFYQNQGKLSQARDILKKAVELFPKNGYAYFCLGQFYQNQGKLSQAEDAFKKATKVSLDENVTYAALSVLYEEMGKPESAEEYAKKVNAVRLGYYSPVTVNNYRKLKDILDKRGIKLVCVQYAMRSIEPLKKIFEGDKQGIIFVDNEKIFKDAVKKEGTRAYFNDMSRGDFGHCTVKGNRLLAGNIASAILKEVFNK